MLCNSSKNYLRKNKKKTKKNGIYERLKLKNLDDICNYWVCRIDGGKK